MPPIRDWATQILGTPLGSRDADEIDDAIREYKADLNERLPGIVVDPAAFPWVGNGYQLVARYHWSLGHVLAATTAITFSSWIAPSASGGAFQHYMPIIVPVGNKLLGVKFKFKIGNAGSQAFAQVQKFDSTGAASPIGDTVNPTVVADFADYSIGPVSITAAVGDSFAALITLENVAGQTNSAQFLDMEITLGPVGV